ncbi:helix-turn-helix transcriptional regulator [Thorsellia kenyensis]|uniref:Helix-turn-helix transcriptional regulator n=1 Tax=Thorsellia kenyensis TaxID=1549888 RepID=A0ABV6CFZ6_9GAMM
MRTNSFHLSEVIDSVNTKYFTQVLLNFLHSKFYFDSAIAFNYQSSHRPFCIFQSDKESVHNHKNLYEQGAYLDDPFYQNVSNNQDIDIIKLHEIAPRDFLKSTYFREFYHKTGWSDETGILMRLNQEETTGFFFSHFRIKSNRFNKDRDILDFFSIVKSLLKLHLHYLELNKKVSQFIELPDKELKSTSINPRVTPFIKLTRKEKEIAELILSGKTSNEIAKHLFISVGTVKNHRKNLYAKLAVKSQCELFALFNPKYSSIK